MSWRKSRPQPFAVPLDALVKEKENANRPVAARSAGTVGKWGITSFTSIRNSSYGVQAYSPQQHDSTSPGYSPRAGSAPTNMAVSPPTHSQDNPPATPKPKKFFKSRNVVPTSEPLDPSPSPSPMHGPPSYQPAALSQPAPSPAQAKPKEKISLKISKKKLKAALKVAPPEKIKAPKKIKKRATAVVEEAAKPQKSVATPTRVMGRARKQVNYNEENEELLNRRALAAKLDQIDVEVNAAVEPAISSPTKADLDSSDAAQKSLEHPPIVLRISKGTSRLISTDSEDVINSPPHVTQSLYPQSDSVVAPEPPAVETIGQLSSTAELLAVLSDPPQIQQAASPIPAIEATQTSPEPAVLLHPTVVEPVEKRAKAGIKIKIKTDFIRAYEASLAQKEQEELQKQQQQQQQQPLPKAKTPPLPANKRATRSSRRTQKPTEAEDQPAAAVVAAVPERPNSPLPGSDNYELYRTLASPPDSDIDRESSVVGSDLTAADVPEAEPLVNTKRVSIDENNTSDLDNLSQQSSLSAQPSDVETSIEDAMIDTDRAALSVQMEPQVVTEEPEAPEVDVRVTRRSARGGGRAVEPPVVSKKKPGKAAAPKKVAPVEQNGAAPTTTVAVAEDVPKKLPIRSYTRKRKANQALNETSDVVDGAQKDSSAPIMPTIPEKQPEDNKTQQSSPEESEYKVRNKYKRAWYNDKAKTGESSSQNDAMDVEPASDPTQDSLSTVNNNTEKMSTDETNEQDKPSVKLVISKKKGSIFKSRALVPDSGDKKRALYKHKWDDDIKDKTLMPEPVPQPSTANAYFDDFDDDDEVPIMQGTIRKTGGDQQVEEDDEEGETNALGEKKAKKFYTVVRNVKKAHQIQEIGEFQEMDDDVEYILDTLQSHNPISTRCLSAIQLASKCMTPAFRMHVRAQGTVTKFFKALQDANKDQSLGLCTATVMFVLSQDNLNMDLDRDSLELMLNLLESDVSHRNALDDCGLSEQQLMRNKQKVRELCEEIKTSGKAIHLNCDNITVGTLAMETLLSMTSKRAGEWFKEELRTLGGLEHIIKTICECARQISDYVVDWTEVLLDKLRKIERCLRVLENVSQMNEENQNYILTYNNGQAVDTLVKLYKLFDSEIALYPTTDQTPKENPGVVLREALVPTLKVLINLAHPFNSQAMGSSLLGQKAGIFDTSLHILLQAPQYVPERCIFELSILVLLLLINLTMHTVSNRKTIMNANEPSDFGNQFDRFPAIKALIEYFYRRELLARQVEQTTDDILDNPKKSERKLQSQEEVEETVTKLLQKAGHHMEHTMIASYVCLLVGHLVTNNEENEQKIRVFLKEKSFREMIDILQKYYNFMNLTASSEANIVAHIKQTKQIIEYFQQRDSHSTVQRSDIAHSPPVETRSTYAGTRNAAGTSTYGSR